MTLYLKSKVNISAADFALAPGTSESSLISGKYYFKICYSPLEHIAIKSDGLVSIQQISSTEIWVRAHSRTDFTYYVLENTGTTPVPEVSSLNWTQSEGPKVKTYPEISLAVLVTDQTNSTSIVGGPIPSPVYLGLSAFRSEPNKLCLNKLLAFVRMLPPQQQPAEYGTASFTGKALDVTGL